METTKFTNGLLLDAKDSRMELVELGRFAAEEEKDPDIIVPLVVQTTAEE